MEYCPTCGKLVRFQGSQPDVPTDHYYYTCDSGHMWEETRSKDGSLLHIAPVEEERDSESGYYI